MNNVDIAIDIHPNVLGSKNILYGIYIYRFINSSLSLVCFVFLVLFVFLFAGLIHHIYYIYEENLCQVWVTHTSIMLKKKYYLALLLSSIIIRIAFQHYTGLQNLLNKQSEFSIRCLRIFLR